MDTEANTCRTWIKTKLQGDALKRLQAETATELAALLPACSDDGFRGGS